MTSFFDNWLTLRAASAPSVPSIPYQRIEYLESTGTQYIDAGANFLFGDEFYFDFETTGSNNNENKGYGAGRNLNYNISGGGREIGQEMRMYMSYTDIPYLKKIRPIDAYGKRYVENWKLIANTIFASIINEYGTDKYSILSIGSDYFNANYDSGRTVNIFRDNSDYPYPGKKKVYECWLKRLDGTFAFHLLPVRDSNNVGYLYDTVSGTLLSNQGTGVFTLGPDIV